MVTGGKFQDSSHYWWKFNFEKSHTWNAKYIIAFFDALKNFKTLVKVN